MDITAGLEFIHQLRDERSLDQPALVVARLVPRVGEKDVHAVQCVRYYHVAQHFHGIMLNDANVGDLLCIDQLEQGNLLKLIDAQQIANIRIIQHDAVEVLRDMIVANTLDGVHIFFPDPWHKARHNKRRLIQAPFIAQLVDKLKPGGYIHVATDWQDYAGQVLSVLSAEPLLENTAADYAPRPAYRPLTKFEQRGIRLGHGVWDLLFRRKIL